MLNANEKQLVAVFMGEYGAEVLQNLNIDIVEKPVEKPVENVNNFVPPTAFFGCHGSTVAAVQAALNILMPDKNPLTCTGFFDWATDERLKAFQLISGLEPDGIAGHLTYRKLFRME